MRAIQTIVVALFTVVLAGPVTAHGGTSSGKVAIQPHLDISDASAIEDSSADLTMVFDIELSAPSTEFVRVHWETSNGSATQPLDFEAAEGDLVLRPGQTRRSAYVLIQSDDLAEGDENFYVSLSAPENAWIDRELAVGTIVDDDTPPSYSLSRPECDEGDFGNLPCSIRLSLSHASTELVSGRYDTEASPGIQLPATSGVDFVPVQGQLWSIEPGDTFVDLPLSIIGDTRHEDDENLRVQISEVVGATAATVSHGLATLLNDDAAPPLNIVTSLCAEGSAGISDCDVLLQLQGESEAGFSGSYTLYGDGENPATIGSNMPGSNEQGADVLGIDDDPGIPDPTVRKAITRFGSWQIPAGSNETTIRVAVVGDTRAEEDETLRLVLLNDQPSLGRRSQRAAMLTIMDDDANGIALVAGDASVLEPDAGESVTIQFDVLLSAPSPQEVRVAWTTESDQATAGEDFESATGVLIFAPGETRRTVDVVVNGDNLVELDESFHLHLGLPVGASIRRERGTGLIRNDEPSAGSLRLLHAGPIIADEDSDEITVFMERADGDSGAVSVDFSTVDGSAVGMLDTDDYESSTGTVYWADGQSDVGDVILTVLDDTSVEQTESFYLIIDAPGGDAMLGSPDQVRIDIIDDDATIFRSDFEEPDPVVD